MSLHASAKVSMAMLHECSAMQGSLTASAVKQRWLSHTVPENSCQRIVSVLQALDVDKSGTVTLDELRDGLAKQGSPITQKEVEQLMESIDVDATGSIDYDEFLAATINMSQLQVRTIFPLLVANRACHSVLHDSAMRIDRETFSLSIAHLHIKRCNNRLPIILTVVNAASQV